MIERDRFHLDKSVDIQLKSPPLKCDTKSDFFRCGLSAEAERKSAANIFNLFFSDVVPFPGEPDGQLYFISQTLLSWTPEKFLHLDKMEQTLLNSTFVCVIVLFIRHFMTAAQFAISMNSVNNCKVVL